MNTAFYDIGNQFRNDNQKADIKIEKWQQAEIWNKVKWERKLKWNDNNRFVYESHQFAGTVGMCD